MNTLILCLKILSLYGFTLFVIFLSFFIKKNGKLLIFGVGLYQLLLIIVYRTKFNIDISIFNFIGGIIVGVAVFYLECIISFNRGESIAERRILPKSWLALIIISPAIEEIFYRILTFQLLSELLSDANINIIPVYLVISAVLVVSSHFQIFINRKYFLQKLLIEGVFLSFIYCSFHSIFLNITAHLTFNVITFYNYFQLRKQDRRINQ